MKVLAIQIPAECPFNCAALCRTPVHGEGDPNRVLAAAISRMRNHAEIYITANGETGLSPIFRRLVDVAHAGEIAVAVLCASKASVMSGLKRVEISLNKDTR